MIVKEKISKDAQYDITELRNKITDFQNGIGDEDRFKSYRLTRGVYGQRQSGVQMVRIKIPFGRITSDQLIRVADVSDAFSNGNLHITTRQNIQLHYVKLEDSPQLWEKLEEFGVTTREACGNTVRGITGSAFAGVDPEELFDISPYAQEAFEFFLRNPICQDMGRKVKIAFSSSDSDSAFTYIHDFGFIPRIKEGTEERGFKVIVGGGLGATAYKAKLVYDFLPEDQIIPFVEAALRVFDRYGEREKRFKARLKFLLDDQKGIGLEKYLELVEIERKGISGQSYSINRNILPEAQPVFSTFTPIIPDDFEKFTAWRNTNVFKQKQPDYYAVAIKLPLGNINSERARKLSHIVKKYADDDIRLTVNQGILLRYLKEESLSHLFVELDKLGLAEPGFDSIADITACPGTDTCNLGVTNSTGISQELERITSNEYKDLVLDSDIKIKISGCMNSCGQHMAASIGFHGSSIKHGNQVIPALQIILGGGVTSEGTGRMGEKVAKLPTKRIPEALRRILNEYLENRNDGEYFHDFYHRLGKIHFYNLLKSLGDLTVVAEDEYVDWGHQEAFIPEIGTGECAGVAYDVISTIINDAEEKIFFAKKALENGSYADSIYNSYSAFVVAAKAILLGLDIRCNTHLGIIRDFNEHFYAKGLIALNEDFESLVLKINQRTPEESFAKQYLGEANDFLSQIILIRKNQLLDVDKQVVNHYYKA